MAATFDYGPYVCHFETGIDAIARFDAHLEVYGEPESGPGTIRHSIRPEFADPALRHRRRWQGGVTTLDLHPAWGDPFVVGMEGFLRKHHRKKVPKTGPADFAQDLELFAEMAEFMREA